MVAPRRGAGKTVRDATPAAGARSILDAATTLFSAEGFDAVSVAAIADKAGVCKANVFHHYPTKEDLFVAVMQEACAVQADYAERLHDAPGKSAPKVQRLIEFEIGNMLANRQRARLTLREVSDGGHATVRKVARQVFQRNFTAIVDIFEQGRQQGEFRTSMDPVAAAMLVVATTMFYFNCHDALHEFRETGGLDTPGAYSTRMASLILAGVCAAADVAAPHRGKVA